MVVVLLLLLLLLLFLLVPTYLLVSRGNVLGLTGTCTVRPPTRKHTLHPGFTNVHGGSEPVVGNRANSRIVNRKHQITSKQQIAHNKHFTAYLAWRTPHGKSFIRLQMYSYRIKLPDNLTQYLRNGYGRSTEYIHILHITVQWTALPSHQK